MHGVECYLTEELVHTDPKTGVRERVRDNYHTILIARNFAGVLELNKLVSISTTESHTYYKPRISFDEFLGISNNIIKISACLASPLNKLPISHKRYRELVKHYDYLEIQPHDFQEQKDFNLHLAHLAKEFGKPLIASTDTHSIDKYKAECRSILLAAKHIEYSDEDSFDLTYKSYEELVEMFRKQDALPESLYLEAIENTNRMADSVESFDLDLAFKYPKLYGSRDKEVFEQRIKDCFNAKVASGAIRPEEIDGFKAAIPEECRVFDKIDMSGFMLFMSELVTWCKSNGIPVGFNRGSCGGSRVAFVTDITDLNPEQWHTVFSRFCNEDRKEIGDIDIDVAPNDRDKVYGYIIDRFGQSNTAFILAVGTIKAKGCIDEVCRALGVRWNKQHQTDDKPIKEALKILKDTKTANATFTDVQTGKKVRVSDLSKTERQNMVSLYTKELARIKAENEKIFQKNPWVGKINVTIKSELTPIEENAKKAGNPGTEKYRKALLNDDAYKALAEKYPDVFYYFEGLLDTAISQSMHPAGIVASPVTLADNYGTFVDSDGHTILQIDMECVHEVSLVKYDILGLKNIEIIKDAYKLVGEPYPKSHEIDWNDQAVWKDMLRSPVGIFQFEGDFAHSMLRQYEPHSIFDMSLITAALRPSGASYRDDLMQHKPHSNPSPMIDELLKDNYGYLIYQEDVIKFLQQICGMSGSDADNTRRAIGRKDQERLSKALPEILEGYCSKSTQPRKIAEQEAKEFLQIIEDASNYMFGYNHSIGYCMIGYLCAYLRYYHPFEFITAYLNNANNEDDIKNGSALAEQYGIQIVPPRYGLSKDKYVFDSEQRVIAKGLDSIKYMNSAVATQIYELSKEHSVDSFMELLGLLSENTSLDTRQRDILIKIDYFKNFGNVAELSRMVSIFSFFKNGTAKRVQKEKLSGQMLELVSKYGTDKNKNGSEAKSFVITDMSGLLRDCETVIKSMNLPDVDLKTKIQNQLE
ncbi:MAG: PHP domain-containing protein, partial [Lachnospiraceae bacterium]|nr:PHP domain-containing protein [Lachnospiraceae bacterium]